MNANLTNHWAVCDKDGAVKYDEDNRAEIYGKRSYARRRAKELLNEEGEKYHAEKVEVGN